MPIEERIEPVEALSKFFILPRDLGGIWSACEKSWYAIFFLGYSLRKAAESKKLATEIVSGLVSLNLDRA